MEKLPRLFVPGQNTRMKKIPGNRSRGFTLVELMIVVSIIGIVSSLAIPQYQRLSARSHRAEMQNILSKFRVAFKTNFDSTGTFLFPSSPLSVGASSEVNPDPAAAAIGQPAAWGDRRRGWAEFPFPPEGGVRMRYFYIPQADHVELHVCGSFPAFGDNTITCGDSGLSGNYYYREFFFGNGTSEIFEVPPF
jgi:prepilin-type N-terminal cleavage/methylation domain-containing protein